MAKLSTLFLLALAGVGGISIQPAKLIAQDSSRSGIRAVMQEQTDAAFTAPLPDAPDPAVAKNENAFPLAAAPFVETTTPRVQRESHPFWDRQNRLLFAFAGGLAGADFYVTHANLASGGRELNPVTRVLSGSTPGLATNFALETGGVIGVSYIFHRLGHHRLEHVTAYVNIVGSAGAVAYGWTHR